MLEPSWWRPGVAILGLGVLALVWQGFVRDDEWWVLGAFIIASGLVLLPAIRRALRRGVQKVLADHLLVLAGAFLVYYVIGALLIPFGPRDQAENALLYYSVDARLAMRVTAANCIGFGLALVFGSLVRRNWVSRWARTAIGIGRSIPQEWVIVLFLLVGGASSFYVLMFDIGMGSGEVVYGLLRTMSRLLLVAIMVAAANRGRSSFWLLLIAIVLAVLQAIGGLLLLSKSSVLLPLLALIAGLGWRLGIRRVIVPGFAVLLAVFLLIDDPVAATRNISGLRGPVDLGERIALLREGVLRPSDFAQGTHNNPWTRFCYLPSQGAALDFYDTGQGGDDFSRLGWAFVPRFLFPTKPIMTSSGMEFHYKIRGNENSSTGQGVFVNGYYNLGWWGVIAVGIAVGCILAWTSAIAAEVYRADALLWLPMALLGSFMAFRIDGHFLADYWGPFVFLGYAVLGGVVMKTLFGRHRASRVDA